MPTKRKFTARFPTTRIKKIMQLDEDIGKLTATVPPVVSRSLELFMEQLISRSYQITLTRASKTISPSCIKHVIEHDEEFDFLRNLVADVPELKPLSQVRKTLNSVSRNSSLSEDEIGGSDNGSCGDVNGENQVSKSVTKSVKESKATRIKRRTAESQATKNSASISSDIISEKKSRGRPRKRPKTNMGTDNNQEHINQDQPSTNLSNSTAFPQREELCNSNLVGCPPAGV